jgi:hypothetical protein
MISQESDSSEDPNSQESFQSLSEECRNESEVEEADNDEIDSFSSFDDIMNDFSVVPPTTNSSPTEQILRQMVERQTPPMQQPFRLVFVNVGKGGQSFYDPQHHYHITIPPNTMNYKASHKHESIPNDTKNNKTKKHIKPRTSTKRQTKSQKQEQNNVKCGCKSSNCIKLYCHCFQGGKFCTTTCNCIKCYNTLAESKKRKGGRRKAAINEILKKKPNAFSTVSK